MAIVAWDDIAYNIAVIRFFDKSGKIKHVFFVTFHYCQNIVSALHQSLERDYSHEPKCAFPHQKSTQVRTIVVVKLTQVNVAL